MTFTETIWTLFLKYLFIDLFNTFLTFTMTSRYFLNNLFPQRFTWLLNRFLNVLSDRFLYFPWWRSHWFSDWFTDRLFYYGLSSYWFSYIWLTNYGLTDNWFISSWKFLEWFVAVLIDIFVYLLSNLGILFLFFPFLPLGLFSYNLYFWCCWFSHQGFKFWFSWTNFFLLFRDKSLRFYCNLRFHSFLKQCW